MKQKFWTEYWYTNGRDAWLFDTQNHLLYKADIGDKTMDCISEIPVNDNHERQFSYIYCDDYKVYLLPDFDNRILVFDIESKAWKECEIQSNELNRRLRCTDCWAEGDEFIIYASGMKGIIYFNFKEMSIKEFVPILCDEEERLWDDKVVKDEKRIIIPSRDKGVIYELDIDTKKTKKYLIDSGGVGFGAIARVNADICITNNINQLFVIDLNTLQMRKRLSLPIEANDKEKPTFSQACFINDKLWLFPCEDDNVICVYDGYNDVEEVKIPGKEITIEQLDKLQIGSRYSLNYIRNDRYIGLYINATGCTIELDTATHKSEVTAYEIAGGYDIVKKGYAKRTLNEKPGFKFNDFLEII